MAGGVITLHSYYSYIPQCPQCGAPFKNDAQLKLDKENNYYICTDQITNAVHIFSADPLPWKIRLNPVECSYIDWIVRENPELILAVTWPFQNPEIFCAILSHEYLKSTGYKSMIVTPYEHHTDRGNIKMQELMKNIYTQGESTHRIFVDGGPTRHLHIDGFGDIEIQVDELSRKILFPQVASYNYSIKSLSIAGRVHAKTVKGVKKILKEIYGEEYAEQAKIGARMNSSFGKIGIYDVRDYDAFVTHNEEKLSELIHSNKIILHEYSDHKKLSNYVNKFDPHLIIFNDIISPFINIEEFEEIKNILYGRTVILIGLFNSADVSRLRDILGFEKVTTLNSQEFLNNISDRVNLQIDRNPKFNVEIINYNLTPRFDLPDISLQNKFKEITETARISLAPLNLLGRDSFGIDDILNQLYEKYKEAYSSFSVFVRNELGETDSNPWALEIARYIEKNNLDKADNFVVINKDSILPVLLNRMGLTHIKTGNLSKFSKTNCNTVILTKLVRYFNPETVNAKRFILFTDPSFYDRIDYFFKFKKYLEYSAPFFSNDKNMPKEVSDIIRKVRDIEPPNMVEVYDYHPEVTYNGEDYDDSPHRRGYQIKIGEKALFLYDIDGNYIAVPENTDIFIIKADKLIQLDTGKENSISTLTGSYIPLDKNGFYASIKARLTYFLLENAGQRIRIDGMPFDEAYKTARIWLDELYNLSVSNKPDLASEIANNLNITAKNEYYISTWWRIIENYRGIDIYKTDRPKSVSDMIKVFGYIGRETGKRGFDADSAVKCYKACVGVQNVRKKLLKNEYPYLKGSLDELIKTLKVEGKNFHVSHAKFGIADKDMYALSIQKDE